LVVVVRGPKRGARPPPLRPYMQVLTDQGADRTTREGEKTAARALVEDAWRAAAGGAAREHQLRRLYICRQLQDMADELEVGLRGAGRGRQRPATWRRDHCSRSLPVPDTAKSFRLTRQDTPCLLPHRLPALLAAMAYSKAEVLWYFRCGREGGEGGEGAVKGP
jgi:hypothetical protein